MPSSSCDLQATSASLGFEAERRPGAAPTRPACGGPPGPLLLVPAEWMVPGSPDASSCAERLGHKGVLLLTACRQGRRVGFRPLPDSRQLHSTVIRAYGEPGPETNQDGCAQSSASGASGHSPEIIRKHDSFLWGFCADQNNTAFCRIY